MFVYVAARNVGLHYRVDFPKAFHVDAECNTLNQTGVMYIVTKLKGVKRGGCLGQGDKVDSEALFMLTEGGSTYAVACHDEMLTGGTRVFTSLITGARGRGPEEIEIVAFRMIVEECSAKGKGELKATDGDADVQECPKYHSNPFPLALLPVTIVINSLITVAIIVLFILDRQHGLANKVDKLSAPEVWRMYHAFHFARVMSCMSR